MRPGGVVGGQIGYRWQTGGWVFGLEAQGDWANLRGDNVSLLFPAFVNRSRLDAFGLFTGQVGYAWNNALFYVKGGAAVPMTAMTSCSVEPLLRRLTPAPVGVRRLVSDSSMALLRIGPLVSNTTTCSSITAPRIS